MQKKKKKSKFLNDFSISIVRVNADAFYFDLLHFCLLSLNSTEDNLGWHAFFWSCQKNSLDYEPEWIYFSRNHAQERRSARTAQRLCARNVVRMQASVCHGIFEAIVFFHNILLWYYVILNYI